MPGIPRLYDPENKDINTAADEERTDRMKVIEKARKYYNGDHDKPLKVEPMGDDDNIILNLSGQTIDKTTDFIGVPTFTTATDGDEQVEMVLDQIVMESDLEFLIPDLITSGQIAGHAFLRIIMPESGEPSPDNLPMLAMIPPEYVTVMWDMSLYGMRRAALWYRLEWEFGSIQRRQDIVPMNLIADDSGNVNPSAEGWAILEYEKNKRSNDSSDRTWQLIAADQWDYPFPPIIDGKNKRKPHSYYGESDLRDIRLNDAVNFVVSNTAKILKHHAHPKTVLTGDDGSGLKGTMVDGLWAISNEMAEFKNLEMQSDLASSMRMVDMLRSSWFTQARVVDMTTQKEKIGQMTNFSVRMLFNDMIEMCGDKRKAYGKMLEIALNRMLFMVGYKQADVMATWADPLPVNRLEQIQTAQAEIDMGVSKTTVFKDLDRDYEAEVDQVATESSQSAQITANRFLREAQFGAVTN